jgi:hypothetical protein
VLFSHGVVFPAMVNVGGMMGILIIVGEVQNDVGLQPPTCRETVPIGPVFQTTVIAFVPAPAMMVPFGETVHVYVEHEAVVEYFAVSPWQTVAGQTMGGPGVASTVMGAQKVSAQ